MEEYGVDCNSFHQGILESEWRGEGHEKCKL